MRNVSDGLKITKSIINNLPLMQVLVASMFLESNIFSIFFIAVQLQKK
jgi:hypothetical protein